MAAPIKCVGRALFAVKYCQENILVRRNIIPSFQAVTRFLSLSSTANSDEQTIQISKAMKAYLDRATGHEKFMQAEIADYEIGKRHLANIMGADPDNFTQDDIDRAIEYLLPSGLFDTKARPMLKHPYEVVPKRRAAEFGMDGRPFNFLFYTMNPNYYSVLHECALKMEDLKKYEDKMFKKGNKLPESQYCIELAGSKWISQLALETMLHEKIRDTDYLRFTRMLERLANMAYSVNEEEFIMKYRVRLHSRMLKDDLQPLTVDEGVGRAYIVAEGMRKTSKACVRVWDKGNGKVTVNELPFVEYFPQIVDREQIMFPLQFTGLLTDVDLDVTVENGGRSSQAGAVRLATARALQSFVTSEVREQMRLAGLLTRDPRMNERKKPGQEKARKKFTWKKR